LIRGRSSPGRNRAERLWQVPSGTCSFEHVPRSWSASRPAQSVCWIVRTDAVKEMVRLASSPGAAGGGRGRGGRLSAVDETIGQVSAADRLRSAPRFSSRRFTPRRLGSGMSDRFDREPSQLERPPLVSFPARRFLGARVPVGEPARRGRRGETLEGDPCWSGAPPSSVSRRERHQDFCGPYRRASAERSRRQLDGRVSRRAPKVGVHAVGSPVAGGSRSKDPGRRSRPISTNRRSNGRPDAPNRSRRRGRP